LTISAVDVAADGALVARLHENNMPFLAMFLKANPSGLGIYSLFVAFMSACQVARLDPWHEFLALLEVADGVPTGAYTDEVTNGTTN
jgi:hypothetical protein